MSLRWGDFADHAPELATFGSERLGAAAAYLGTTRRSGAPRVHPVAPLIVGGRLCVFMEPTSPKGRDLRERGWYALHSGVPDLKGTGGEFFVIGHATLIEDPEIRRQAREAATFPTEDRWILFELDVHEARCNGYGDVVLPVPGRWTSTA